jgi:hypothetical protein
MAREAPVWPREFGLTAFSQRPVPRRGLRFAPGAVIFAQGAAAQAVFYIQESEVKLSVSSSKGKEAVVAVLGPATSVVRGAWHLSEIRKRVQEIGDSRRPSRFIAAAIRAPQRRTSLAAWQNHSHRIVVTQVAPSGPHDGPDGRPGGDGVEDCSRRPIRSASH